MTRYGEQIVRLWKEIADSPGGQIRYDLETLEVTIQVFKTNHHWLHDLLLRYENPGFAFRIWPDRVGDFLVEVAVRLHNFVASVMTLVEHTRILVRSRWSESEFFDEYTERIEAFRTSPVAQFVQDLRDYTLHRKLPVTGAQISSHSPPVVFLEVPKLKDWPRWSKPAQALLDKAPDNLPLRPLIDEYERLVEGLYVWMENRIKEIHASDWAVLEELERRLAELEELDKREQGTT
jgi:hypothetical protein